MRWAEQFVSCFNTVPFTDTSRTRACHLLKSTITRSSPEVIVKGADSILAGIMHNIEIGFLVVSGWGLLELVNYRSSIVY